MSPLSMKLGAALLAGSALVGTLADASAKDRYDPNPYRRHYHGNRGYAPGAAVAGAALGVLGAGIAGVAASRYYHGYPAYDYGQGYGPAYGYDYHPSYGYYGPY